MASLTGKIVWVVDGGRGIARTVALALASRGVHVLVTGTEEHALGECVGEIAHGGGKARHFVADTEEEDGARACVAAAVDRFGGLDAVVVFAGPEGAERVRQAAGVGVRVVAIGGDVNDEERATLAVLAEIARA